MSLFRKIHTARPKRVLAWAGAALAVYAAAGFLIVPQAVKKLLVGTLSAELKRPVELDAVAINPFALSMTLRGLVVRRKEGDANLLAIDELYANAELSSLWHRAIVLRELRLNAPRLHFARVTEARFDISDIIDAVLAKPASEPMRFSVANLQLIDGSLSIDDKVVGKTHALDKIRVNLPLLSNLPIDAEIFVEPVFEARLDDAAIGLNARARPFDTQREGSVSLDLSGLAIADLMAYVPDAPRLRVDSGRLDLQLGLDFKLAPGQAPSVRLRGKLDLIDVALTDSQGAPLAKWTRLAVALEPSQVLDKEVKFGSLSLDGADLTLVRTQDGKLNIVDLLARPRARAAATSPAKALPSKVPTVELADVQVRGARISWTDQTVAPPVSARIDAVDLHATGLSNQPDRKAAIQLEAKVGDGQSVSVKTQASLSPLAADGEVRLVGVSPLPYSSYYRAALPVELASALMSGSTSFRMAQRDDKLDVELSNLAVEIKNLSVLRSKDRGEFLHLDRLAVTGGEVTSGQSRVKLAELLAEGGRLSLVRNQDGGLDVLAGMAPAAAAGGAGPPTWQLSLGHLALNRWNLHVEDRVPSEPVALNAESVEITADNLSTGRGEQARFSLKSNLGRGTLAASGVAQLAPVAVSARITLRNLDILPFQPYATGKLNATLRRGSISAGGELEYRDGAPPSVRYKGDLVLANLQAVDANDQSDLLSWKSLGLSGINAANEPPSVDLGDVTLSEFFARINIDPQGKINLQKLLRDEAGSRTASPPDAPTSAREAARGAGKPALRVGRIALDGGRVSFKDQFIKPNYSANMVGLSGSVGGMSSRDAAPAEVKLTGRLDGGAPLAITGNIQPFREELFLDIAAKVRGIELPPLSAYSAKYAGYGIDKGKLSLDVQYRIENRKLEAQNRLVLDQLTFGAPVESPDATKLPVLLAVALLKNSRGEIDIELPISGSVDDPQFNFGAVIGKAVLNLIGKAVTAPFRLLGALFGGGEDLGQLDFEPGRSRIGGDAQKRLASLAKALKDRPGLTLEVTGRIDPQADAPALQRLSLERRVRAAKRGATADKPEAQDDTRTVVSEEEYPRYLERVYKAAEFDKPKNALGFVKGLPVAEMEKLLLDHTRIGDDELTALATRRSQRVKEWLVGEGGIEQERVFVLAPQAGGDEKSSGSRVEFSLR